MQAYETQFNEALARAANLGFPQAPLGVRSEKVTKAQGVRLMELLQAELGGVSGLRPEDVAFRCGRISTAMARHVDSVTGLQTVLTLGTVSEAGTLLWKFDPGQLQACLRAGTYHVWLTTTAMEVLDFRLLVSIRRQRGHDLNQATPVAGNPNHIEPYRWLPAVAGNDAVRSLLQIA